MWPPGLPGPFDARRDADAPCLVGGGLGEERLEAEALSAVEDRLGVRVGRIAVDDVVRLGSSHRLGEVRERELRL